MIWHAVHIMHYLTLKLPTFQTEQMQFVIITTTRCLNSIKNKTVENWIVNYAIVDNKTGEIIGQVEEAKGSKSLEEFCILS